MTVRRQDAAGGRQRDDRTTTGIRREGEKRKPGGTLPQKRCRAQRASELSGKLLGQTSGRSASCYHNRTTPDMFQFFKIFFGSRVLMRYARQTALELRWRAGGQAGVYDAHRSIWRQAKTKLSTKLATTRDPDNDAPRRDALCLMDHHHPARAQRADLADPADPAAAVGGGRGWWVGTTCADRSGANAKRKASKRKVGGGRRRCSAMGRVCACVRVREGTQIDLAVRGAPELDAPEILSCRAFLHACVRACVQTYIHISVCPVLRGQRASDARALLLFPLAFWLSGFLAFCCSSKRRRRR